LARGGARMRKLLFTAALAVLGCGADTGSRAPEEPKPFILATFTGEVDAAKETFTIQYEPTALGQALGMTALVIPSGTPGVTVGNVAGTLWNHAQTGCGATSTSGGSVRVTSNYSSPTVLGKVFAEITMLTPMSAAACNSDASIPGVSAANGGLWSYGDIAAAGQADKVWAFAWSSGVRSTFAGRIVAFQVDAWSAKVPSVSNLGYRMAGTGTSAIFVESGSNRLVLVNASGTVTESSVLSAAPTGVGTSADGSRIWVSLGAVNRIARLDATGQLVGAEIPVAAGGPQGIAVDPISGVVWFALPGSGSFGGVGWYDPATQQQGVINAGSNGGGVSPIVAVNLGGRCSPLHGNPCGHPAPEDRLHGEDQPGKLRTRHRLWIARHRLLHGSRRQRGRVVDGPERNRRHDLPGVRRDDDPAVQFRKIGHLLRPGLWTGRESLGHAQRQRALPHLARHGWTGDADVLRRTRALDRQLRDGRRLRRDLGAKGQLDGGEERPHPGDPVVEGEPSWRRSFQRISLPRRKVRGRAPRRGALPTSLHASRRSEPCRGQPCSRAPGQTPAGWWGRRTRLLGRALGPHLFPA
jgi:hypothetical protein